ncbi:MAG: hypothetical protein KME35_14990 [Aphanocapsa sp. GSE-SYN-MK-11-07L]|jgi:hypothetical protein|nr:hypothetical protein [Aphanocapsa sp. GSE-SYN-MK-11-07L]
MQYPQQTMQRAIRAVRCSPFQRQLFADMRSQQVSLQAIAGPTGVEKHYTQSPLAEMAVESALLWLMQVGLLRREVDGQGLTDSFRLTPLGRELIEVEPAWMPPTLGDRLQNILSRLRLPG